MSDVEFELPGSCSPLPTHIAAGATLSYEPLMLGRTEEMTTLFQSLLNAIFVPEGENGWPQFQDAATVYVQNLLAPLVPPVACGALLLLCLLPLWISRCCAHRCCAPGLGHQRRADKITSAGCCCLFAFGMLGAAAGGVLGAVQSTTGFKAALCEAHALADNQTDTLNSLGGALRDVATAATDSLGATASLLTAVQPITAAFATGGSVGQSCTELSEAATAMQDLKTTLDQNGASSATLDQVVASLVDGMNDVCALDATVGADVAAIDAAIGEANSAVTSVQSVMLNALDSLEMTIDEAKETVDDIGGGLETFMGEAWPYLSWAGIACGFAIFALSILVVLQAGVGSLCLWCDKRAVKRCCCHGCGVQMVGCAWVGASMCGVLLFVLSAVFLLIALAIADVGYVAHGLAEHPTKFLGQDFCNSTMAFSVEVTADDGSSTVVKDFGLCTFLEECTASDEYSLWSALQPTGGDSISASLIDERTAALDANRAELEAASAEIAASKTAIDLAFADADGKTPEDFGMQNQPGREGQYAQAAEAISKTVNALGTTASTVLDLGVATTDSLSAAAQLASTLPELSLSIDALVTSLSCSALGIKELVQGLIAPAHPTGDVLVGLVSLAVSMFACAAVSIGFIFSAIAVQIRSGGVGTEAGCPKACRCCCPMTRDNSEKKRTAKFKMAEVAATGTTITV